MNIIIWGIISSILVFLWGISGRDSILIVGGLTIGILTYLHYKATKNEEEIK